MGGVPVGGVAGLTPAYRLVNGGLVLTGRITSGECTGDNPCHERTPPENHNYLSLSPTFTPPAGTDQRTLHSTYN